MSNIMRITHPCVTTLNDSLTRLREHGARRK